MATGHGRFALLNRTANPALGWLLRSPLHRLASWRLSLITYTGRRSGRRHTIPTRFKVDGDVVTITAHWADRKLWWRNLTGTGARVELVVRGRRCTGHAVATRHGDHAVVRVALDR
jgi:hypothetical protein